METYTVQTKNYRTFSIHSSDGTCIETLYTNQRVKYCLPGDTVVLNSKTNCYMIVSRANYPLLAGRLELASKTKYGMTKKGYPMYLFLPFRKEFPPFIVGCSEKKPTKNRLALIEFENWLDTSHLPRGSIQQMIGTCGDFDAEKKALLFAHSPWKYPSKMAVIVTDPFEKYMKREMTPPFTFSIDPPGCCDVDDVISIDIKKDSIELWISIADVASAISPSSQIDDFASMISQTTYCNGEVVRPMLPLEYSHGVCSLLQGEMRLGISLILKFLTKEGTKENCVEKRWARTQILNRQQYTYDTFVENGTKDGIPVEALKECLTKLGDSSQKGDSSDDVHKWVEIAMLTYNKEAASLLRTANMGILRRHAGADQERWTAYEALKPGLGRLAEASAQYCFPADDNLQHKGLGAEAYCHASSPIRRYADLVNQRAIHAILDKKEQKAQNISWKELAHMNQRSRDIKHYERDVSFLKIIQTSFKKTGLNSLVLGKKEVEAFVNTWKYSLWIEEWSQIVSWKTTELYEIGQTLELDYFLDMENRFWKDRIVFRLRN